MFRVQFIGQLRDMPDETFILSNLSKWYKNCYEGTSGRHLEDRKHQKSILFFGDRWTTYLIGILTCDLNAEDIYIGWFDKKEYLMLPDRLRCGNSILTLFSKLKLKEYGNI